MAGGGAGGAVSIGLAGQAHTRSQSRPSTPQRLPKAAP